MTTTELQEAVKTAMDTFTKVLHHNQPLLTAGLDVLGEGHFGDLRVEFHGSVERAASGRFIELWLEDVTVAGTTISVKDCIGVKEWERMEEVARDQFQEAEMGERAPYRFLPRSAMGSVQ